MATPVRRADHFEHKVFPLPPRTPSPRPVTLSNSCNDVEPLFDVDALIADPKDVAQTDSQLTK